MEAMMLATKSGSALPTERTISHLAGRTAKTAVSQRAAPALT